VTQIAFWPWENSGQQIVHVDGHGPCLVSHWAYAGNRPCIDVKGHSWRYALLTHEQFCVLCGDVLPRSDLDLRLHPASRLSMEA